jgi:hypothetical protein
MLLRLRPPKYSSFSAQVKPLHYPLTKPTVKDPRILETILHWSTRNLDSYLCNVVMDSCAAVCHWMKDALVPRCAKWSPRPVCPVPPCPGISQWRLCY